MHKRNRRIEFNQARYLNQIVNNVRSIKRSAKFSFYNGGATSHTYSRRVRRDVQLNNGQHYRPTNIKSAIKGMTVYQKARIMREVYRHESGHTGGHGARQHPIWGDSYGVKDIICKMVFPHHVAEHEPDSAKKIKQVEAFYYEFSKNRVNNPTRYT